MMNQFKGPQFDLGMRGHLDSFADVNLDADLINSPALWRIVPATANFNPTTWRPLPTILNAGRQLSKQLEEDGLDTLITSNLGLNEDAIAHLSDTAIRFSGYECKDHFRLGCRLPPICSLSALLVPIRSHIWLKTHINSCMTFAAYRLMKWLGQGRVATYGRAYRFISPD